MGGIVVNLILGIPLACLFFPTEFHPSIFTFFLYSFALFHLVEAATYLTISNIFLASDMVDVQNYNPKLRIPFFIIGIGIVVLILFMIMNSPDKWKVGYIISIIIMIFSMALGRMLFSRRAQIS